MLVIRDLADGRSRFCELERSLEGISPRTLSLRLRSLEEEGIVERRTYPEVPPRVEYALTEKGRALVPIIESMRAYGTEWLGATGSCSELPEPTVAAVALHSPRTASPRALEKGARRRAEPGAHAQPRAARHPGRVRGGGRLAARRGGRRGRRGPLRADRAGPRFGAALLLPAAHRPLHRRAPRDARAAPVLPRRRAGARGAAQPLRLPDRARAPRAGRRPPGPGRRRARGVHHGALGRRHRL